MKKAKNWKKWFNKMKEYAPETICASRFSEDHCADIDPTFWEQQYQAFKSRLLEETTATEIKEGDRVGG